MSQSTKKGSSGSGSEAKPKNNTNSKGSSTPSKSNANGTKGSTDQKTSSRTKDKDGHQKDKAVSDTMDADKMSELLAYFQKIHAQKSSNTALQSTPSMDGFSNSKMINDPYTTVSDHYKTSISELLTQSALLKQQSIAEMHRLNEASVERINNMRNQQLNEIYTNLKQMEEDYKTMTNDYQQKCLSLTRKVEQINESADQQIKDHQTKATEIIASVLSGSSADTDFGKNLPVFGPLRLQINTCYLFLWFHCFL